MIPSGIQDSLLERVLIGIMAAVIAGTGTLAVEVMDYVFWGCTWVEADTLADYIRTVWFLPVGAAVLALGVGIWKGADALTFAWDCWRD